MTPEEIRSRLEGIITKSINKSVALDQVAWDTRLWEDLGIDSLETVELLFEIEESFGVRIDDVEAADLRTVKDTVETIQRKLKDGGP